MKPTARKLAIYEAYSELESQHAYTETIGLVHRANDLPPEFDSNVKAIFSMNKPFVDIYNDQKLKVAKDQIEEQAVNLLSEMITEGDKNSKPVDLSVVSMKNFLISYEQLRNREKHLI